MRLKNIKITNFKRFTDTTVGEIPETARLVIIAGPNGCGKSSFFESLNIWSKKNFTNIHTPWDVNYFEKIITSSLTANLGVGHINVQKYVNLEFHGGQPSEPRKAIYIRSAYRNDPEFKVGAIQTMPDVLEEKRLDRLIENDATVSKNYQRLVAQGFADVFENMPGSTTVEKFRDAVIGDIKSATQRLFPDLVLNSLGNPLTTGTFKFDKGITKGFLYKNLSGGEKAAFDLLLDIIVKRRDYNNTVFCIDEPEVHMNSRLQGKLLEELYNATGDQCQLWLATHSVGMMRRARDLEKQYPGSVVFLDFGDRDFDKTEIIKPEQPNRGFWQRVLDVAFDDFAELIAPNEVILCEGSKLGEGGRSEGLDSKIYERIFGVDFPDTRFIPGGNSYDVKNDRLALIQAMQSLVKGTKVRRLIDRDDLSEEGVEELRQQGISVLSRRNLESYLFDDDVIRALARECGKPQLAENLINEKSEEMRKAHNERGRPVDDVKASVGPIMNILKRKLSLTQCGNTPKEFMYVTLAPHLTPNLPVYADLKNAIFLI